MKLNAATVRITANIEPTTINPTAGPVMSLFDFELLPDDDFLGTNRRERFVPDVYDVMFAVPLPFATNPLFKEMLG